MKTSLTSNEFANNPDPLTAIRQRKAIVREEINKCTENMRLNVQKMCAPPQMATSKMEHFMNMIDQGMAVYDGVMLGMRVMRNIRHIFGRKRR